MTSLNVGELELEGKSVPVVTSAVCELKFVGVFIEIVNAQNLSNNIEVLACLLCTGEVGVQIGGNTVVGAEVGSNPLSEGSKKGRFVLFESGTVS